MIDYAVASTTAPASLSERDVVPLRDAGLADEGIHAVVSITAYFNFVNRIALGLGVELE